MPNRLKNSLKRLKRLLKSRDNEQPHDSQRNTTTTTNTAPNQASVPAPGADGKLGSSPRGLSGGLNSEPSSHDRHAHHEHEERDTAPHVSEGSERVHENAEIDQLREDENLRGQRRLFSNELNSTEETTHQAPAPTNVRAQISDVSERQPRVESVNPHDQETRTDSTSSIYSSSSDECDADEHHRDLTVNAPVESGKNITKDVEYATGHSSVDFDHIHHTRPAVVHEEIKPHVHTIRHVERTRSIHYHEHKTWVQPIEDPNPTILPAKHWAQDQETGEVFKVPDELGETLMETGQTQYQTVIEPTR